jgi:putative ATP-dependent endonuclease of the OLD family
LTSFATRAGARRRTPSGSISRFFAQCCDYSDTLLDRIGLDTARDGIAVIAVHGKGNLAKWRRLFTAYGIASYVIFDNDGDTDDKKKTKRRDALASVGVFEACDQDAYLSYSDLVVGPDFAVFGSNFEQVLRGLFADYVQLEEQGRKSGVDSKPFLAKYVAENVSENAVDGWNEIKGLADALRDLMP